MYKRILSIGYNLERIQGFEDLKYSNYSLSHSTDKRWQNKLSTIKKYIDNNELKCIIIVIGKYFIDELKYVDNDKLFDLFRLCGRTNCLIAIQEYLLEDKPLIYDHVTDRKYSIIELEDIVKQLELDLKNDNYIESEQVKFIKQRREEINDKYDLEAENEDELLPSYNIDGYKRKLELLRETDKAFPRIKELINIVHSEFDNIVTFQFLNQIFNIAKDEITEQFSNEILNIYIPSQYGYRYEFDDFIQLFEKYLKNVEQLNISVEINETSSGINYKFISNDKHEKISDLPNKFSRFTNFIDLCEKQPDTALELLDKKNINPKIALEVIQRLSKKYKRLALDIQQQQERIELAYKQEVQAELFEAGYSDTPFSLVQNSFSVKTIEDIYLPNEEEKNFINIIQKHDDSLDIANIKSDLGIIKDQEIKLEDRKKSGYKLKKLLNKIVHKGVKYAERIAIESLMTYINSKIN